jgi:hypothetical protein
VEGSGFADVKVNAFSIIHWSVVPGSGQDSFTGAAVVWQDSSARIKASWLEHQNPE